MGFLEVSNPFYREKEDKEVKGSCKTCSYYNPGTKVCSRYRMYTEPYKTCKSCKEKK